MHCPSCQRENRDDARFCDGCGGALQRSCAGCGRELRADAAFCDGCGERQNAAGDTSDGVTPSTGVRPSARGAGYEVELQGDGFLLAFGSARKALHCAIGIQRAMESHSLHADEPIRVRTGLHTGEALRDADKFFGKTVILASRIAAQAKGGEILVSELLRALTESSGDLSFGASRTEQLKGIAEPQRLHEVIWGRQAEDTRTEGVR